MLCEVLPQFSHAIRSAIAENSMLHRNFTALSSIHVQPDLLPIKVLQCVSIKTPVLFSSIFCRK